MPKPADSLAFNIFYRNAAECSTIGALVSVVAKKLDTAVFRNSSNTFKNGNTLFEWVFDQDYVADGRSKSRRDDRDIFVVERRHHRGPTDAYSLPQAKQNEKSI